MSKFDEAFDKYKKSMDAMGLKNVNEAALKGVAKSLGPSIYLADASLVSCSQEAELDRVKNNFLIKKLGLADSANLDKDIKAVCETMGSSNRSKHRAIFYYLLAEKHGKLADYEAKA